MSEPYASPAHILLLYSSVDGHTRKICAYIADKLTELGMHPILASLDDAVFPDPDEYAGIIIGASIRYGKHRPNVKTCIETHKAKLQSRPSAMFSVNMVARKPNRNTPETNPYLSRFLKEISWAPQLVAVFAGKINYPRYTLFDRTLIRLIMWITKGPTDPATIVEFTDWPQVENFAQTFAERFRASERQAF